MKEKELSILKALVEHPKGLISPAEFVNGIAQHDGRSIENLVAKGYVEEVPQDQMSMAGSYTIRFYRATEKGLMEFAPWYSKFWFWFQGDVRTITVSVVAALITTLITLWLGIR